MCVFLVFASRMVDVIVLCIVVLTIIHIMNILVPSDHHHVMAQTEFGR